MDYFNLIPPKMRTLKAAFYLAGTVFSIAVLLTSCGGRQGDESRAITGNKERDGLNTRLAGNQAEYPIPTSVEIIELLYDAGAPYILGISNPAANADRYFTERSKALNLGVYGADLSYAATYEMNQEIRKYLQVSKRLIDELNISTTFNRQFVEQVENNLDDKDALIHLVSDSFYDTYGFLTDNHQDDLSLLVLTGSWIEGMYLTSQIALGARDNTRITDIIIEQDEPLEKLLFLMEDLDDNEDTRALYLRLSDIHSFLKTQRSPMTSQALGDFAGMIENLRTEIVE
jgi:hypothetical protein